MTSAVWAQNMSEITLKSKSLRMHTKPEWSISTWGRRIRAGRLQGGGGRLPSLRHGRGFTLGLLLT